MKFRSECGFTLIEVIVSMVILTVGIGIISSIVADVSRKNFFSQNHTQAVIMAQNKIEELLNEGYESPDLEAGAYENPLNPVSAAGDTSGIYYQYWAIEDLRPIPRSKEITSLIQWEGADGDTKSVVLTAVCIDQSN